MYTINYRKLGIIWIIVESLLAAYVLLFSYAALMRTLTFGFQDVIAKSYYPVFIITNIFMIMCCFAMIILLLKKDRRAFIAQAVWFIPSVVTIFKNTYNQEQTEIVFQKYLFYMATGPSVYIPIEIDPLLVQIDFLDVIALFLISYIYRKSKSRSDA